MRPPAPPGRVGLVEGNWRTPTPVVRGATERSTKDPTKTTTMPQHDAALGAARPAIRPFRIEVPEWKARTMTNDPAPISLAGSTRAAMAV